MVLIFCYVLLVLFKAIHAGRTQQSFGRLQSEERYEKINIISKQKQSFNKS